MLLHGVISFVFFSVFIVNVQKQRKNDDWSTDLVLFPILSLYHTRKELLTDQYLESENEIGQFRQ